MVRPNHVTLFFHLEEVVEIRQSDSKDFFTLTDTSGNDVVLYGDCRQQLFNEFVRILPKVVHPRALRVITPSEKEIQDGKN